MDPTLGRFITPDPINDFINPYSYVHNNPMNMIDPTGMAGMPVAPLLVGIPAWSFADASVIPMWMQIKIMGDMISNLNSSDDLEGRIRNLARIAMNQALKMQAIAGNDKDVTFYSQIALELWNVAEGHVSIIIEDFSDHAYTVTDYFDDGSVKTTGLLIDEKTFFGSDYNQNDLVGFMIHEGAHMAFNTLNSNFYSYYKNFDNSKDVTFYSPNKSQKDAKNYHKYVSEIKAYTAKYTYYSTNQYAVSEKFRYRAGRVRLQDDEVTSGVIQDIMRKAGYGSWIDNFGWDWPY